MKSERYLVGSLTLAAAFAMPVLAQQAPQNAPNPSMPPEGGTTASADRGNMDSQGQMSGKNTTAKKKSSATHSSSRSMKLRQQDAAPVPTADAPSGPKGDSPDPASKQ